MRKDLIKKFCQGIKPVDLIKKKQGGHASDDTGENRNTAYKYYGIYKQLKKNLIKDEIINKMIENLVDALE